jgi:hypothetical protein
MGIGKGNLTTDKADVCRLFAVMAGESLGCSQPIDQLCLLASQSGKCASLAFLSLS